jgi:hypothetical protein
MAWVLLISAGLLETGFAVSLEQGKRLTRLPWDGEPGHAVRPLVVSVGPDRITPA